jgi:hypothetical protein
MADAQGETHGSEGSTNGLGDADVRAAFIAGELGDDAPAEKAPPTRERDADEDEDADLDGDGDDEGEESSDESEVGADEDADLDDEDAEDASEKSTDPETSKRVAQVQRTDKRLREQREKQFAEREKRFADRESHFQHVIEQWKPRVEAAERYESLKANARFNLIPILKDLGFTEDDWEPAGRELYAHSKKGAEDPKNAEAVARTKRERERDDRLAKLEKRESDREASDKKAKEDAAAAASFNEYIDTVVSVASKSEKLVLAKQYVAKNPTRARADMQRIANSLYNESGTIPDKKDVAKALEKERRAILRDHGVDPKSVGAAKAADATEAAEKKNKPNGKSAPKPAPKPANDDKPFTKDDFIKMKFD